MISIHAPARGATKFRYNRKCVYIFQSTLPRGERPCPRIPLNHYKRFQSTLPRGERLRGCLKWCLKRRYFNPRSREGSDDRLSYSSHLSFEFQSTLPRGERRFSMLESENTLIFQSTLPRGERRYIQSLLSTVAIFQSTLPRGERQQNCTHSQYFFRELCESCQNLQITLTNYSFFYLIICFLQSFSSANQLVFSCSLIIRTN